MDAGGSSRQLMLPIRRERSQVVIRPGLTDSVRKAQVGDKGRQIVVNATWNSVEHSARSADLCGTARRSSSRTGLSGSELAGGHPVTRLAVPLARPSRLPS